MLIFRLLFILCVLYSPALVAAQRISVPSSWKTLSGNAPLVIAKGGFSGLYPDSSYAAYNSALMTSSPHVILWCDVLLTKDGAGICFPDLKLENSSDISTVFNDSKKVYNVNGEPTEGWFSVDYTLNNLSKIHLTRGIYSRAPNFDGNRFSILTAEDIALQLKPPGLWLNIQHDAFFKQFNLSMRSFVLSISRRLIINYVSSPEVAFLSSIAARFKPSKTKLVFRFLGLSDTEPSTNQTYDSLLNNLTFVRTFASGILVPKNYIWPVNDDSYLEPPSSVVLDAHKEGLEVFASDFANDVTFSYNYSYDPVAEYLSFIDNDDFSVDGVLSDFPITASEAIDCFSHISKNDSGQARPLVISHNGASGVLPGSTDVAYQQAVKDGADVIDCSVQMTKDGIPICLSSINLLDATTVSQSQYGTLSVTIPQIQEKPGIFTFNLTWKQIQELKPAITNPFTEYELFRNPKHKNDGNFVSLDGFLTLARNKPLYGVLISIENAAYLAESLGLSVIDSVLDSLSNSGYNNHTSQRVMIQSTRSSVLIKFKEKTNYELVYKLDENIHDALNSSIEDIKQFAHSVAIKKKTIFPDNEGFLTGDINVVQKLHSFNLSVYAYYFRNEFVSNAWDFFGDPIAEINSYVMLAEIDGVITDFPGTAIAYRKNRCLKMGNEKPNSMLPVVPGILMQNISASYYPQADPPFPVLTESDIEEPPFPPVSKKNGTSNTSGSAVAPTASSSGRNGQPSVAACVFLSSLVMLLVSLLLF